MRLHIPKDIKRQAHYAYRKHEYEIAKKDILNRYSVWLVLVQMTAFGLFVCLPFRLEWPVAVRIIGIILAVVSVMAKVVYQAIDVGFYDFRLDKPDKILWGFLIGFSTAGAVTLKGTWHIIITIVCILLVVAYFVCLTCNAVLESYTDKKLDTVTGFCPVSPFGKVQYRYPQMLPSVFCGAVLIIAAFIFREHLHFIEFASALMFAVCFIEKPLFFICDEFKFFDLSDAYTRDIRAAGYNGLWADSSPRNNEWICKSKTSIPCRGTAPYNIVFDFLCDFSRVRNEVGKEGCVILLDYFYRKAEPLIKDYYKDFPDVYDYIIKNMTEQFADVYDEYKARTLRRAEGEHVSDEEREQRRKEWKENYFRSHYGDAWWEDYCERKKRYENSHNNSRSAQSNGRRSHEPFDWDSIGNDYEKLLDAHGIFVGMTLQEAQAKKKELAKLFHPDQLNCPVSSKEVAEEILANINCEFDMWKQALLEE